MLTSHWKWLVGAPEGKVTGDWQSEGPQAGLCREMHRMLVTRLLCSRATAWAEPPNLCCVRKVLERGCRNHRGASWTPEAGQGLGAASAGSLSWGEGCWPVPVASSRLVKSCYQNGGVLKTAQEAGEETFREEINKRGDRLLTLAKGALAYLWNFTPPLPLA